MYVKKSEYSNCHWRSSFPSRMVHIFLQRTELQLTSWGVSSPLCCGPQMSFVCFPRPWPPGSQSPCMSGGGSIWSPGGWNAIQVLGMICNLPWPDFLPKKISTDSLGSEATLFAFWEDHLGFTEDTCLYLPACFLEGGASLSWGETNFLFSACFAV